MIYGGDKEYELSLVEHKWKNNINKLVKFNFVST